MSSTHQSQAKMLQRDSFFCRSLVEMWSNSSSEVVRARTPTLPLKGTPATGGEKAGSDAEQRPRSNAKVRAER